MGYAALCANIKSQCLELGHVLLDSLRRDSAGGLFLWKRFVLFRNKVLLEGPTSGSRLRPRG